MGLRWGNQRLYDDASSSLHPAIISSGVAIELITKDEGELNTTITLVIFDDACNLRKLCRTIRWPAFFVDVVQIKHDPASMSHN